MDFIQSIVFDKCPFQAEQNALVEQLKAKLEALKNSKAEALEETRCVAAQVTSC